MARDNKYPESFKIGLVKRYLNGELAKDICEEQGVANSTFWGWNQKYSGMILKEWKVEPEDIEVEEEFIDIRN